jgi:hypothetical protein
VAMEPPPVGKSRLSVSSRAALFVVNSGLLPNGYGGTYDTSANVPPR